MIKREIIKDQINYYKELIKAFEDDDIDRWITETNHDCKFCLACKEKTKQNDLKRCRECIHTINTNRINMNIHLSYCVMCYNQKTYMRITGFMELVRNKDLDRFNDCKITIEDIQARIELLEEVYKAYPNHQEILLRDYK